MEIKLVSKIPEKISFSVDLFNTPEFYKLHLTAKSEYLCWYSYKELLAIGHFTEIEKGIYVSPYRGTYGGITFAPNLELELKSQCLLLLKNYFLEKGARKLLLTSAPFDHSLHLASHSFHLFLSSGFKISKSEINHSLLISESSLYNLMTRNNRKRYNKCLNSEFIFLEAKSDSEKEQAYEIIKLNRQHKNFPISMTLKEILKMEQLFENTVLFFLVKNKSENVASSICIRINPDILYVFYWGEHPDFKKYSPVTFLASGIFNFAKEKCYKTLDVGTSSLNGVCNFGVVRFKEGLGFKASPKITFCFDYE